MTTPTNSHEPDDEPTGCLLIPIVITILLGGGVLVVVLHHLNK